MDIKCPLCGEPWDIDELHYVEGKTFSQAYSDSLYLGCAAFGTSHGELIEDVTLISVVYDLLGDDVDGAASILEG